MRVAQRITGETAEAEDAAQDAFIKAYANLPSFRPDAPFRPWLLRIVANEARNRKTAAARRAHLWERAAAAAQDPASAAAPAPEAAVLSDEARQMVHEAVGQLRADERQVVSYRYLHELSEAETAAALGWPRGTVKSRLSRAMTHLRHSLPALAALALALLAAFAALSPRARAAVADRLGLRGVSISYLPEPRVPPTATRGGSASGAPAPPPTAVPGVAQDGGRSNALSTPASAGLSLGTPVTLAEARSRASFTVLVPSGAALGQPDEVYLSSAPAGGQVWLVYRTRAGYPVAGQTGVSVLFSQFRGQLQGDFIRKGLGPRTRLEEVTVNGSRGYWMDGDPHFVVFLDGSGRFDTEYVRLAANVLLWEQSGLTVRLETAGTKQQALGIAATVR